MKSVAEVYLSKWPKTKDTFKTMLGALNGLARVLGGKDATSFSWEDLRNDDVRAIPAKLTDAGLQARTVNKALSALRGVLETAWRSGRIPDEEYRLIKITNLHVETEAAGRALTQDEVAALAAGLQQVSDRDAALIVVSYACGLRRVEVARLRREDFNVVTGRLTARGKRNKVREIPVASEWVSFVAKHWSSLTPRSPAFGSRKGGAGLTRAGISGVVENFCTVTGIKRFTPHDLRRSFATHVLDGGGDIAIVQRLMGHASITTTTIYDRRDSKAEEIAVNRLHRPKETP